MIALRGEKWDIPGKLFNRKSSYTRILIAGKVFLKEIT